MKLLDRSVPLWFLMAALTLWIAITVTFGWLVKSRLNADDDDGLLREVVLGVASFPDLVVEATREIKGFVTGTYKERAIRLLRDETADYSDFTAIPAASGLNIQGLLMKVDRDRISNGWRLLVGAFSIDDDFENAALLLSPELEIVRVWVLDEKKIGSRNPKPKHRKFIHGVEFLPDASIIYTFDGGVSLQRVDVCGRNIWATEGGFNHTVSLDGKGETVWSFSGNSLAQVSVSDGSLLRVIEFQDIIDANPMIDILGIRQNNGADNEHENPRNYHGGWMGDRFHRNDVEPLPSAMESSFPDFSAGDLLVSLRSLNLVFVVDPDTRHIKWWRMGATERQHDPDWNSNGTVTILNNRMTQNFSEIVSISPENFEKSTLFDGRKNDFFTRIRGKHQVLDTGEILVASSQQGRFFEVDPNGEVSLEIVNTKPGSDDTNYVVSEVIWYAPQSLNLDTQACQSSGN